VNILEEPVARRNKIDWKDILRIGLRATTELNENQYIVGSGYTQQQN